MSDIAGAIGQEVAYVQPSPATSQPPPFSTHGPLAWARRRLFSDPTSTALTVIAILVLALLAPWMWGVFRFIVLDAIWSAQDGAACRGVGKGACWPFIENNVSYFVYAAYPYHWRVNLWMAIGGSLVLWLLWPSAPKRGLGGILLLALFPLLTYVLLSGFTKSPIAAALDFPLPAIDSLGSLFQVFEISGMLAAVGHGIGSFFPDWVALPGWLAAVLGIIGLALDWTLGLVLFWVAHILQAALALVSWFLELADSIVALPFNSLDGSNTAGRPPEELWALAKVPTEKWGGLFVNLLIAIVGIVASLPIGILLALGRRSKMPIVKVLSVVFIEFVRGVPFITVLFMANTMLPLFVPDAWSPDKLLRPLFGVALFSAAYMAENVRGGLQAIPKGQHEGSMALGIGYWKMTRLVILPQTLMLIIPSIVNSFIGLFKDTTLVAIVGIPDFLKAIEVRRLDPKWAGPTISPTGYLFAAIVFFIFCFGMARYSIYMERKLNAGKRH